MRIIYREILDFILVIIGIAFLVHHRPQFIKQQHMAQKSEDIEFISTEMGDILLSEEEDENMSSMVLDDNNNDNDNDNDIDFDTETVFTQSSVSSFPDLPRPHIVEQQPQAQELLDSHFSMLLSLYPDFPAQQIRKLLDLLHGNLTKTYEHLNTQRELRKLEGISTSNNDDMNVMEEQYLRTPPRGTATNNHPLQASPVNSIENNNHVTVNNFMNTNEMKQEEVKDESLEEPAFNHELAQQLSAHIFVCEKCWFQCSCWSPKKEIVENYALETHCNKALHQNDSRVWIQNNLLCKVYDIKSKSGRYALKNDMKRV